MKYNPQIINPEFTLYNLSENNNESVFLNDVLIGLSQTQKSLPPKYFYDSIGSDLFEQICTTKEYYLTKTETEILNQYADDIISAVNNITHLVELGSGSSVKTQILINSYLNKHSNLLYSPIDVSDVLIQSSNNLIKRFRELKICGVIGQYIEALKFLNQIYSEAKLILFLGSSVGNFTFSEARDFLINIADLIDCNDYLLIGFDLVKDTKILTDAYNDSKGYTEKFNLNILNRINNELKADFNIANFKHSAFYNSARSRIEMHLVSDTEQIVNISGREIKFLKNETIHTENSYKFTYNSISDLITLAAMQLINIWYDKNNYFALCLIKKSNP